MRQELMKISDKLTFQCNEICSKEDKQAINLIINSMYSRIH